MTAEPIAEVIADIRAGRVQHHVRDGQRGAAINAVALKRARAVQPVVDVTAIYRELHRRVVVGGEGVNLYDDYPSVAAPWSDALFAYLGHNNNVIVMQVHTEPWSDDWKWETDNPVDWSRVRWVTQTTLWGGGRNQSGEALRTGGPIHMYLFAVYEDGQPADLHWVQLLPQHPTEMWEVPLLVLNASLNFLACSNVEVAEPKRPFPVRRRLRQQRVQVQTIVVRPPGKRTRNSGEARPVDALDTALTSVRGSFARYGPEFDRGLLFGKYAGKFWRPAYVRGVGDAEPRDYVLKPGRAA